MNENRYLDTFAPIIYHQKCTSLPVSILGQFTFQEWKYPKITPDDEFFILLLLFFPFQSFSIFPSSVFLASSLHSWPTTRHDPGEADYAQRCVRTHIRACTIPPLLPPRPPFQLPAESCCCLHFCLCTCCTDAFVASMIELD